MLINITFLSVINTKNDLIRKYLYILKVQTQNKYQKIYLKY